MKTREIIIAFVMFMLLAFALGYFVARGIYIKKIPPSKVEIKYDTLLKPGEIIKIQGKGKIVYTNHVDTLYVIDTIYFSRPFISFLDTIHKKDTIHVSFFYPLNMHYLTIKPGQDSIFTKTITIYQPYKEDEPWYKLPLTIIGSVGAGYLIGKATK